MNREAIKKTTWLGSAALALYVCCATAHAAPSASVAKLQFEQMLIHVYENNPKLQDERLSLKISDEKVSQANAGFRPNVTAALNTGRQRAKTSGQPWRYGDADSRSLIVSQPLFSGFGTVEQKRAAEARVLAGRARLLSIEQNILFTAINDWLTLSEKERILVLNELNMSRLRRYANATHDRFKGGDGTRTDVAQAQSRLAQAEVQLASAIAARDSAQATFMRDVGMVLPITDFPALPSNLPTSRDEAESQADNNPALRQAEQEERAAEHDIGTAESALWPKVSLRGSLSQEDSPTLGLDSFRNDSVTLNVTVPLYQGGGEYSRVREAELARQKSVQNAIDMQRSVRERAQIAWDSYYAAGRIINASSRALEASNRALEGVLEEQRQGLRTVTEVLDEQSERLAAQISQTQAQKNLRVESYRLLAATGQLTKEGLGLDTVSYNPGEHHAKVKGQWAGF